MYYLCKQHYRLSKLLTFKRRLGNYSTTVVSIR